MSLDTYNAKRDFLKTAEPAGDAASTPDGDLFIVQKHAATRLHYDFRLELDGVLLSWAVTRGPSADPDEKRLAVRTEDHPLSYASFEGTIPKGEYGGGTVMLWDRGRWACFGDPHQQLAEGRLHIGLDGARMKGEWVLIRLRPRPEDKGRENWLLRKVHDMFDEPGDTLVERELTSVDTDRTMDAIRDARGRVWHSDQSQHGQSVAPPPAFRQPQLATLQDAPPPGGDWLHEVKYDGYRCLLAKGSSESRAYTRSGRDWTDRFRGMAEAALRLNCRTALVDGEVVVVDAHGMPRFGLLQAAFDGDTPMQMFVFDCLELDGEDLTGLPLDQRKARLRAILPDNDPVLHYSEHVTGSGARVFDAICQAGHEGVVSKRADAPYRSGRTLAWRKTKCVKRQEFVIGGWAKSDKGGRGFASLLLGLREGDALTYAGRVGTGFSQRDLDSIGARLEALRTDTPPFAGRLLADARRGAVWVRPELVAEVAYAEITADGNVRHASFIGLREDKPAGEVVREVSAPAPPSSEGRTGAKRKVRGSSRDDSAPKIRATPSPARANARVASPSQGRGNDLPLCSRGIAITHPDRVIFPEIGLTKRALVEYYDAVSDLILPDLAGRPLSLVRCPQGRGKACFFQKHDSGHFPLGITATGVPWKDRTEQVMTLADAGGIIGCVQMNTLEFHGWGSRLATLEQPDRLVFDLDPDEGLGFDHVKRAAHDLRALLRELGLESWPLLSGGKGVHVVVPLLPGAEWPAVKALPRTSPTPAPRASRCASPRSSPRPSASGASSSIISATSAARPRSCRTARARARTRRWRLPWAGANSTAFPPRPRSPPATPTCSAGARVPRR